MNIKQTTINMIHNSQLTDFFACCSRRSDSSFSFSKFWSAIRREWDSVWGHRAQHQQGCTEDKMCSTCPGLRANTADSLSRKDSLIPWG